MSGGRSASSASASNAHPSGAFGDWPAMGASLGLPSACVQRIHWSRCGSLTSCDLHMEMPKSSKLGPVINMQASHGQWSAAGRVGISC